jgi:hypothetical protein
MEPKSESPPRPDDPVFSSRKWILIAFISACAWLAFTLYVEVQSVYHSPDWGMDLLWLIVQLSVQIALLILLFNVLQGAWRCGERRSFDLMAIAVKAQCPFILALGLLAAAGTVSFAVWAHEDRMYNTGLKQVRDSMKKAKLNPPAHP